MRDRAIGIVVAAAVFAAAAAVYVATPTLQPASARQRSDVDRLVARGERLLADFNHGYALVQAAEMKLASLGAPAGVEQAEDLVGAITADQLVDQIAQTLSDLGRAYTGQSGRPPRDRIETLQTVGYPPLLVENWFSQAAELGRLDALFLEEEHGADWPQHMRLREGIGVGAAQQAQAVRTIWSSLKRLREANATLLDRAEATAREALNIISDDIRANHLVGTVLFHKARLKKREAALKTVVVALTRDAIVELAGQIVELSGADRDFHEHRKLDVSIREAVAQRDALNARLSAAAGQHDHLTAAWQARQTEVGAALADVEQARSALDDLTLTGFDPATYGSFAAYVRAVRTTGLLWREKAVAHQELVEGTLHNARIPAGADLTTAPLEPIDPGRPVEMAAGVPALERDLAIATDRRDLLTAQLQQADAQVAAMEELKRSLDAASQARRQRASALRVRLQAQVDEEDRLTAEARRDEEEAAQKLAVEAKRYFQQAAGGASSRMASAGFEVAAEDDPATLLQQDDWLGAAFVADEAAVLLLETAVWLQQVQDLRARLPAVRAAAAAGIGELDPASVTVRMDEARRRGLASAGEAVATATNALAHDNQWFYQAQVATGHALMWLLEPGDRSALERAIQAYQSAVAGREADRYADPYVRVLQSLREAPGG